ncbi:unnamed protein product [Didymodactylos carnosus]|uniref:Chaperone DnaJ C-terminal domain-containing protein n=1 Tax=Didymodactylos carnosus TaxID=1234261 RepID=A0A813YHX7_9BILA|nr:unnamed protein product [Didymodactylos carnosus]CAF3670038.1 unnamed protein product [Didymodactylos carnosus]
MKQIWKHFLAAVRDASLSILTSNLHFLRNKKSAISLEDICNISNAIHLCIVTNAHGLSYSIQFELMKYWLEIIGIIRASAETLNIDFLCYLNNSNTSLLRSGCDLIYTAPIKLADALNRVPVNVPLLSSPIVHTIEHKQVINPKTQLFIERAGLPLPCDTSQRGRIIVNFDIEFPDMPLGVEAN